MSNIKNQIFFLLMSLVGIAGAVILAITSHKAYGNTVSFLMTITYIGLFVAGGVIKANRIDDKSE